MTDARPPLAGLHVLLVEDDYVVAMELERWLRAAGARVIGPAARVEQALGLIGPRVPDAAVLDINLDVGFGIRPALWVAMAGLALAAVNAVRLAMRRDAPRGRRAAVAAE